MKALLSITVTSKNDMAFVDQTFAYIQERVAIERVEDLHEAFDELIANVFEHAYPDSINIYLHIDFVVGSDHIRINIEEKGLPFDFSRYVTERLDGANDHSKGFLRVYDLVELFYFSTLSDRSKRFTLIQPLKILYPSKHTTSYAPDVDKEALLSHLDIRVFKEGDGEGIAQLVYHNYDYTYYKSLYYDPKEIREANLERNIISIVAKYHHRIIGHFALIPAKYSNIAEIAVAVVDPKFKQMGIMNAMFDVIIDEAHNMKLDAIYGEGMMMHPYSQRANLRHGMIESAIVLGEVPAVMEIEHKIKDAKRSGVIMAFLLFNHAARSLHLPKIYSDTIHNIYNRAEIPLHVKPQSSIKRDAIIKRLNSQLNIGGIVIEAYVDERTLKGFIDELLCEQYDMIFADINLHRIARIDDVVLWLNQHRFFYCGVLFNFYHDEDYLRLQRINSTKIDEENLICYSEDAKQMLTLVLEDKKRVRSINNVS